MSTDVYEDDNVGVTEYAGPAFDGSHRWVQITGLSPALRAETERMGMREPAALFLPRSVWAHLVLEEVTRMTAL